MSFWSWDRETILDAGPWKLCAQCGEATLDGDTERHHALDCSLVEATPPPTVATPTRTTTEPCRDPHMYVWTARGIERLMDVEARQRRAR